MAASFLSWPKRLKSIKTLSQLPPRAEGLSAGRKKGFAPAREMRGLRASFCEYHASLFSPNSSRSSGRVSD